MKKFKTENITTKKTTFKTQNHDYTIDNLPPEINSENYPNLNQSAIIQNKH